MTARKPSRLSPLERAAMQCVDKQGFAFRFATDSIVRTYFINERAFMGLEREVAAARRAAALKKGSEG